VDVLRARLNERNAPLHFHFSGTARFANMRDRHFHNIVTLALERPCRRDKP
jgi:hypothetical protein